MIRFGALSSPSNQTGLLPQHQHQQKESDMMELYGIEEHERDCGTSTYAEWDRDEARHIGAANRDECWILTGADVWHRNPFYTGPKQRHPEDDRDDEE
tara:strand:- start:328 stop:621 length:294 start_codon:yes stop_codon:yes gene_type:complete